MRYAGRTARGSALAARIDAVPIALALPRLLICSRPVPPQYKIDSPVADIQWVGSDKKVCAALARCAPCACTQVRLLMVRRSRLLQTIYVRSSKNFVYRSEDEGRSWERQNWKMEKTSDDEKSGILSFHVSPSDTNKVRRRGRCCAQRRNRRVARHLHRMARRVRSSSSVAWANSTGPRSTAAASTFRSSQRSRSRRSRSTRRSQSG